MINSDRAQALVNSYRRQFGDPRTKPPPRSSTHLQDTPEHDLVITAKPGTNGRVLRLRCRCMAEYRNVSRRYYNYDPFAEAASLEEALAKYEAHKAGQRCQ